MKAIACCCALCAAIDLSGQTKPAADEPKPLAGRTLLRDAGIRLQDGDEILFLVGANGDHGESEEAGEEKCAEKIRLHWVSFVQSGNGCSHG